MAITQNPIIGRSSGKFSTAIFQKWKNKNVIRSKPLEVNNPDTPNQQMYRSMFAFLVAAGRNLSQIIEVGFSTFKSQITWMNAFVKYNSGTFVQPGTPPNYTRDWSELTISKGPLTPTVIISASSSNGNPDVTVSWPTTIDGIDQSPNDVAYVFVYNETSQKAGESVGTVLRSAGAATITLTENNTTGDLVNAYLFFQNEAGTQVGDSYHFQEATV